MTESISRTWVRAGSAVVLLALSTAAGAAGFPATALAKPTTPHHTAHIATAAAAVTGITVNPSTTSVDVNWTGRTTGSIANYVASVDGTHTCTVVSATGAQTCPITGLVAGTTYTATVVGQTSGGVTVDTGTSSTFTVGTPGAPTGVFATANTDGSISVSWAAPVTTGTGIVDYTVTGTPGGTCTATVTTCTIAAGAPLVQGTPYTFTVKANGATNIGQSTNSSAASTASTAVTDLLSAPITVSATLRPDGSIRVAWLPPVYATGVTGYTVTTSPGGKTCPVATSPCDIPAASLTPGVPYAVTVRSAGAAGLRSAVASPAPDLPVIVGPLNPPTNVMATGGSGTAMVSWTAPTGFPTAPLSPSVGYYTVTGSHGDVCNTPDYATTTCTVTGLANFTSSTFTVVAHSTDANIADSPASAASAPVTSLPAAITLKSQVNGKYVTAESAGSAPLIANRTAADTYEKFWVVQNSDGSISLKSAANGMYVTANPNGTSPLIANRTVIGTWEKFGLVSDGGLMFTLMAMSNGKYVSADQAGALSLVADRSVIGTWETFALAAAS